MEMTPEIRKVIVGTKLAIEIYGWVQGTNGSLDTGLCLNGALKMACRVPISNVQFHSPLYGKMCQFLYECKPHWIAWNDTKGRTKYDVLEFLNDILEGRVLAHAR